MFSRPTSVLIFLFAATLMAVFAWAWGEGQVTLAKRRVRSVLNVIIGLVLIYACFRVIQAYFRRGPTCFDPASASWEACDNAP